MSKRLLFAGALAAFVTISGLPSLITNLIISKGRHAVVHASSNKLESRQNHSALKSPTADAVNNANPLVSQASFVTLNAGSLKAQIVRRDDAVALQYDASVAKEEVDLGEIFIDSGN